jgi:hypothetical protein
MSDFVKIRMLVDEVVNGGVYFIGDAFYAASALAAELVLAHKAERILDDQPASVAEVPEEVEE